MTPATNVRRGYGVPHRIARYHNVLHEIQTKSTGVVVGTAAATAAVGGDGDRELDWWFLYQLGGHILVRGFLSVRRLSFHEMGTAGYVVKNRTYRNIAEGKKPYNSCCRDRALFPRRSNRKAEKTGKETQSNDHFLEICMYLVHRAPCMYILCLFIVLC